MNIYKEYIYIYTEMRHNFKRQTKFVMNIYNNYYNSIDSLWWPYKS